MACQYAPLGDQKLNYLGDGDAQFHSLSLAISNNVGGVKHVLEHTSVSTHRRAPFRSRCGLRFPTSGSL